MKRKEVSNLKKFLLGLSLFTLLVLAVVFYSTRVLADEKPNHGDNDHGNISGNFNPDKQLNKSACGDNLGEPLVNITEKVRNDADSGVAGDYWAFDYFTRHIQAWSTGEGTYCSIVTYDGQFYAVPGQISPENTPSGSLIDSPVVGDMSGGYRGTFTGKFAPTGAWPTHGNVGTVDYRCNINGVCPGSVDWIGQYFPGYGNFLQPWWGWIYRGESHGTWINSSDGNSGNIL